MKLKKYFLGLFGISVLASSVAGVYYAINAVNNNHDENKNNLQNSSHYANNYNLSSQYSGSNIVNGPFSNEVPTQNVNNLNSNSSSLYSWTNVTITKYNQNNDLETTFKIPNNDKMGAINFVKAFSYNNTEYVLVVFGTNNIDIFDAVNGYSLVANFDNISLSSVSQIVQNKQNALIYLFSGDQIATINVKNWTISYNTFTGPTDLIKSDQQTTVLSIETLSEKVDLVFYIQGDSSSVNEVDYAFVDSTNFSLISNLNKEGQKISFDISMNLTSANSYWFKTLNDNSKYKSILVLPNTIVLLSLRNIISTIKISDLPIAQLPSTFINFNDATFHSVVIYQDNIIFLTNQTNSNIVFSYNFVNQTIRELFDGSFYTSGNLSGITNWTNWSLMGLYDQDTNSVFYLKNKVTNTLFGVSSNLIINLSNNNSSMFITDNTQGITTKVNSTNIINILPSNLVDQINSSFASLSITVSPSDSTTDSKIITYSEFQNVKLLSYNNQSNSAIISFDTTGNSWFNNAKKTGNNGSFIVEIRNLNNLQSFINLSWMNNIQFIAAINSLKVTSPLTLSVSQVSNQINPLQIVPTTIDNIEDFNLSYSIVSTNTSSSNPSVTIQATLTYKNPFLNTYVTNTSSTTFNFPASTTIFQLYGWTTSIKEEQLFVPEQPLSIKQVSALFPSSNPLFQRGISNYLPSYISRIISTQPGSTEPNAVINRLIFNSFISSIAGISIQNIVLKNADDTTGTLTLEFIFSSPIRINTSEKTEGTIDSITQEYTGFKTNKDFFSNFLGSNIQSNNKIDVQKVNFPSPLIATIKDLNPYTIMTGNKLIDLLSIDDKYVPNISIDNQELVQRYLNSFINTNLNLMNFNPLVEVDSFNNLTSFMNYIKTGTLTITYSYKGEHIGAELAQAVGLDPNTLSRTITYTNFELADKLFNVSLNQKQVDEIIDNNNSNTNFNSNQILALLNFSTYSPNDTTIESKWIEPNNSILEINVTPKNLNPFIVSEKILPSDYNFQVSWIPKQQAAFRRLLISALVPSSIILVLIITLLVIWYRKKIRLKKFF